MSTAPRLMWNQHLPSGTALKLGESPDFSVHKLIQTKGESSLQDTTDTPITIPLSALSYSPRTCFEEDSTERSESSLSHLLLFWFCSLHMKSLQKQKGRRAHELSQVLRVPRCVFSVCWVALHKKCNWSHAGTSQVMSTRKKKPR